MESSDREDICGRITQVRLEVAGPRGKARFAKQLGISPSTYDYYESTRVPPVDVLLRMAEVAGVDISWLLTGGGGTPNGPSAGNPVVQRAAALLADSPDAAVPLAAFIDLLAEVQAAFPAGAEQAELEAGHGKAGPARGAAETARAGGRAAVAQAAGAGGAGYAGAAALDSPAAKPVGGADAAESASDVAARRQWVPILGRSAAGVAQFWRADDETAGLTTLAELISHHADQARRHVQAATLHDGAAHQPAQVITLRTIGAGEVPEYVKAGAIKADYPDAFAVRIDGGSMSPDIAHGDVVLLSPSAPAVDGRAAVVQLTDQIGVTCKLYRRDGQTVHLVPINEELTAMSVPAGDVVWALRVLARVRPDTAQAAR